MAYRINAMSKSRIYASHKAIAIIRANFPIICLIQSKLFASVLPFGYNVPLNTTFQIQGALLCLELISAKFAM